ARLVVRNVDEKPINISNLNGFQRDRSYMSYVAAATSPSRGRARQESPTYDIYDQSHFSELNQVNTVRPISSAEYDQSIVFCDFETRNTGGCKLEIAGAWRYAADPATEVVTLVYQEDDGDSLLWTPDQGNSAPLADLAADRGVRFV